MPSYLDLGLFVVILISALLAMLRGFTREVLAIASWVAAAVAGRYLYPYLLPYVKPYLAKELWAIGASVMVIFFVTLILVSIITVNLSDAVLDSKVGAIDRSLGFLFGAARGFILCVIAFVFFTMLDPADKQPVWVKNARMRPLLQSVGDEMQAMLPHDLLNDVMKFKPAGTTEPADTETPNEKSDAEQNSPAPLPPPRDSGGKGR